MIKHILIMLECLNGASLRSILLSAIVPVHSAAAAEAHFYHSLNISLVSHKRMWRMKRCGEKRKKPARNAIIFQYFMSYHLHISDMFQNALVIFAYFAVFAGRKEFPSFPHRKIKIFHSINHVATSPSVREESIPLLQHFKDEIPAE